MAEPVSLVMVGVGGMGAAYLEALLERRDEDLFRIAGAVDPQPNRCKQYVEMRSMGVPCFVSLQDFYRNRKADLAVLSSPIQLHMPQTAFALAKGSHVLCEKPAAGTIQEVRAAIEAEKAAGRWVAVGYQWSFSPAVQALKEDIRTGLFGAAKRFKCLYLWPRDEGYYTRNDWAGKRRDAEGAWVLDSPVQNAMAHDLHNMFYVLGKETDDERQAGRGRGRALPGQRHRELRHRGRPRPDGGGRRDPVLREPRLGRGPGAGRALRVREGRRPVRQPDVGPLGRIPRRDAQGLRRARRRADEQALAVDRRGPRGGRAAALRARGGGEPDPVHERDPGLDAGHPRVPRRAHPDRRVGGRTAAGRRDAGRAPGGRGRARRGPGRHATTPGSCPPRWA